MLYKDNKKDAELQMFRLPNIMSYCDLVGIDENWQAYSIKSMQNFNITESIFLLPVPNLAVMCFFVTLILMYGNHTQTARTIWLHRKNQKQRRVSRILTFIPHFLLLKSDVHVYIARCALRV